jgi:type I restriction enzyme M protein
MNILVHGLQADIRAGALDAVRTGHEGGPVDVVITNPPFNVALGEHARHHWRYGPPPPGNANFAWLQHALAALSDAGRAAVITANGATFSRQPAERSIRAAMIEDGAVDCVVALPPGLFASTAIPVSLWILRKGGTAPGGVLLVDASELGETRSRSRRRLGDAGIRKIVMAYRDRREGRFEDEPGFARHVAMDEIRAREHSLSPPAYLRSGGPAPLDTASTRADVDRIQDVLAGLRGRAQRVDEAVDRLLRGEG